MEQPYIQAVQDATGSLGPVREAAKPQRSGTPTTQNKPQGWITIRTKSDPDGDGDTSDGTWVEAHVFLEGDEITRGPSDLLHCDIRHLPPLTGKQMHVRHAWGRRPVAAKSHPSYAVSRAGARPMRSAQEAQKGLAAAIAAARTGGPVL